MITLFHLGKENTKKNSCKNIQTRKSNIHYKLQVYDVREYKYNNLKHLQ